MGELSTDFGDITNNGNNMYTISNIPNDQDVTVTVNTTDPDCEKSLTIEAPDCVCIELDFDWTNVTCLGQNDGTISVNFVTEGAVVTVNGQPYVEGTLYPPGDYLVEAYFEGNDDPDCYLSEAFKIFEPEAVTVQATHTDVTCHGAEDGTITVFGLSENASYVIQLNGIGPDLSDQDFFGPGLYIITAMVSDEFINDTRSYNPCVAIETVTILEPAPTTCDFIIGYDKYPDCDDPKYNYVSIQNLTGAYPFEFSWSINASGQAQGWSITSDPTLSIVYFDAGYLSHASFICVITDVNGCVEVVEYDAKSLCEGRQSVLDYEMYPNPVKNVLTLDFKKTLEEDTSVEVYDLLGNISYSNVIKKNERSDLSIDFGGFPANVYYVKIVNKKGTIIKKVIVDK